MISQFAKRGILPLSLSDSFYSSVELQIVTEAYWYPIAGIHMEIIWQKILSNCQNVFLTTIITLEHRNAPQPTAQHHREMFKYIAKIHLMLLYHLF